MFLGRNNAATGSLVFEEERVASLHSAPQATRVERWYLNLSGLIVSLKKRTPFMTSKLKTKLKTKERSCFVDKLRV